MIVQYILLKFNEVHSVEGGQNTSKAEVMLGIEGGYNTSKAGMILGIEGGYNTSKAGMFSV